MAPSAPKSKPQGSSARKINPDGTKAEYDFLHVEWEAYKTQHGASVPIKDKTQRYRRTPRAKDGKDTGT